MGIWSPGPGATAGADRFTGDAADETADGLGGADTLNGAGGNDTLAGSMGDDSLTGGAGNDFLEGGAGNDVIASGTGFDNVDGGAGADLILVDAGSSGNFEGGVGNDVYRIAPQTNSYIFDIGGVDYLEIDARGSNIVFSFSTFDEMSVVDLTPTLRISGVDYLTILGGNGDDAMGSSESPTSWSGTIDNPYGGWMRSLLDGGGGNDALRGGQSNDILIGGDGDDQVSGGWGDDRIGFNVGVFPAWNGDPAQRGDDRLDGGLGNDTIWGGDGNDTISGGEYNAEGNDALYGGDGHDSLTGSLGNDVLYGDATVPGIPSRLSATGNDTLTGGDGDDTMYGGDGNDVYMGVSAGDVVVELAGEGRDFIVALGSFSLVSHLYIEDLAVNGLNYDGAIGIGNDLDNAIQGGGYNDTLDGGAGSDTLRGGDGDDTYVNPLGDTIVDESFYGYWAGTDLVLSNATYSLEGKVGVENLTLTGVNAINGTGNALNNSITGNQADNVLIGGGGADTLEGGEGFDTLIGGASADTYINPLLGEIVELANQGYDSVVSNVSFSLIQLVNVERVELTGAVPGFARGNSLDNVVIGNAGSNTLLGNNGSDLIMGGGGRDTLTGGAGRDTLAPGLERDTIKFDAVSDSTSANRDIVSEFVFSNGGSAYESLDFHVVPTALRATIVGGAMHEASFDQDLAAAVNAARLGAHQAVLFDPSTGDLRNGLFLVVDVNGVAGYQSGQDYVVQFSSSYGTLTLANFI